MTWAHEGKTKRMGRSGTSTPILTMQGRGMLRHLYKTTGELGFRSHSALITEWLIRVSSYRAIRDPTASEGTAANQVEMVTVPALGAEWKASELRDMTKSGRAEARAEERRRKWREFNRDQRGLCGQRWATRRTLVIGLFITAVV